jgi:hypothetical protein
VSELLEQVPVEQEVTVAVALSVDQTYWVLAGGVGNASETPHETAAVT